MRRRFDPWHLVLAPTALLFVLPLVWLLLSSLMSNAEINKFPPAVFPSAPHLDGYLYVLGNAGFPTWFLNSCIVACTAVVSNLVLCTLAAYGFARLRFRGSTVLFGLLLTTVVVPVQLTMIPTFLMMKALGLTDSLGGLIVPGLASALGVFLLRQFFLSLPVELEDAARIDGCSRVGVLLRIVLPLARPALTTLAVLTFLGTWNDLTWPLIVISTEPHYTLQLGLTTFSGQHRSQWSAVMAGDVITTLPVVLAFLFGQRYFVASLTSTGLKG